MPQHLPLKLAWGPKVEQQYSPALSFSCPLHKNKAIGEIAEIQAMSLLSKNH
jgi:hypothetical protein